MGAQRCPLVTAGPTYAWEAPRRHISLSSLPKHKGTTSSGPTNSAELTTRASMASLPGLMSTQTTRRPLNSRIMTATRQKTRALVLSCGGRPFRAVSAVIACFHLCCGSGPIMRLLLLLCYLETFVRREGGQMKSTHLDQPQPRGRWSTGSAADAVADVRGLRRVAHLNDLQLHARGQQQHLEQPTATTEQHRDLMDLQLVQHTGLERPLRRVGAMHHHVPVPGGVFRLCHRAGDPIGHVRHQRKVGDQGTGRAVTEHEDRNTVMITAPVIDELGSPPSHEDRAGRVEVVYQLSGRPGRPEELPLRSDEPIVQPVAFVAEGVAEFIVGTGDVSVE